MDQTPISQNSITSGLAALLVDGENIHAPRAGAVKKALGSLWPPSIRRVYGDASKVKAWEDEAGFRLIHSGCGKNSADMLLAIDALCLGFEGQVGHIIIASSDGDFSHAAHRLREIGLVVTGVGEARTPARFQKACTRFVVLPEEVPAPKASPTPMLTAVSAPVSLAMQPSKMSKPKSRTPDQLSQIILEMVKASGPKGIAFCKVHPEMLKRVPDFTLAKLPANTWRAYFRGANQAKLFCITGEGPTTRISIAKP